ncbi:MAG TPA: OmpA family protein, partial [Burkholderiaceae bacterium]
SGNQYWKNSTGQCWRSSTWTPAEATPECDPELFKKAEAPAPKVAEAPPPEPKIVPQRVSFSSEDLFDFNKTELKPDGKAKLDKLANELKDARYDTIMATGHTDRIGNKSYNQKLSEQRAESVRAYLVSRGIPADRIRAEGKGESEPVTAANQCQGMKGAELSSCLQVDRRVEVQVNATKDVVVRPAS